MTEFTAPNPPNSAVAAFLTFLVPGLGLAYCRRPGLGALVASLPILMAAILVGTWEAFDSSTSMLYWSSLTAVGGYVLFSLGFTVFVARRARSRSSTRALLVYSAVFFGGYAALEVVAGRLTRVSQLEGASLPGDTMVPSVMPGDSLMLDNAIKFEFVERGDIVGFHRGGESWIARVIGLPNDALSFSSAGYAVNGQAVSNVRCAKDEEDALESSGVLIGQENCFVEKASGGRTYRVMRNWNNAGFKEGETVLGPDEFFVVGDNREFSQDSRDFGPVKVSDYFGVFRGIYGYGTAADHGLRESDRHF